MMTSGIDIVILVYKMLNVPSLRTALGQGNLWQHNIPQNSPFTEVAIRIPTTDAYESELRFFDIDIRTPNLEEFHPHQGRPQDNTFPDLERFKEITDIILPLVVTQGDFYVTTKIPGVPMRDSDGGWRVNIRVEFTLLDAQESVQAMLIKQIPIVTPAGGTLPNGSVVWSGQVRRARVEDSPNANVTGGVYGLYLKSTWLLAKDQMAPQKDMILKTAEAEYIITGVVPEDVFWRMHTVRKDVPNA